MELFLSLIVVVAFFGLIIFLKFVRYRNSDYGNASGNTFFATVFDKGNYGEFLTFSYLEKLNGYHKLMTNLYIPKKDGTTTEVDLVMISKTGIYVFESKNYSGWIFGDEKSKNWTQSLQNGQKNRFYNPIWQNKGHINALKISTGLYNSDLYKSYIIFSERCTLKKIDISSQNIEVIKRNSLLRIMKLDMGYAPEMFTTEEVDRLYMNLQKFTHVERAIKKEHIENIKSKM